MLLGLHIKNVALIEEAEIEFGKGLNVLSGETGAGKSMIIDSINFVLGERTSKDFVRTGEAKAQVEAEFYVKDLSVFKMLKGMGIEADEETIIIQRLMTCEGKSTARINGTVVTAGMLKQFSENLIDIHGQHEHQSLLNPSKHMDILDKFCGNELEMMKGELSGYIKGYKLILSQLKEISGDDEERAEKIERLKFKIDEIEEACLKQNEEDQLIERKNQLNNMEKIIKLSAQCTQLLYSGTEEENSAADNINEAERLLASLIGLDESTEPIYESVCALSSAIEDVGRDIRRYNDSLDTKPGELDSIEERLDLIYRLKKKYGATVEAVLMFGENAKKELDFIENSAEERKKLTTEKNKIYEEIKTLCEKMTQVRTKKAHEISKEIETQLKELEMKNATFKINVSQKETFNSKGRDVVEFMISPNLGEELKPLAKIASGGEMSRVMLALKTVVADADIIDTFIFDEIDTGVSGNTASRVGEKMERICKKRQVLCITHLPQIAAMADTHFLIEKTVENNKTLTHVEILNEEGQIKEISRLMGGASGGLVVIEAAKEMKKAAKIFKQQRLS